MWPKRGVAHEGVWLIVQCIKFQYISHFLSYKLEFFHGSRYLVMLMNPPIIEVWPKKSVSPEGVWPIVQ